MTSERVRGPYVLVAVILLAAALRLWGAACLPLSGDEAYHWEWSRHLAGAYYDHPGMTAWLIALSERVWPGGGELAVRLPAMGCLLLTTALACGLARDMARSRALAPSAVEQAGLIGAALVFFVPLPAALSVYMSTDPPLMPCWLGAAWALFAAIERGRTRSWLLCGVCIGLAASTKLISLQLLGAIFAFLVMTRAGREWLRRPQPWLALAVALIAASPMLIWNAAHDWMTFRFNFDIRQRDQALSAWHPLVFVAGQAATLTPGFLALALGACFARSARARPAMAAVLACAVLPLAFFVLVSFRRKIGVHWPAAPWLVSFVLLSVSLAAREPWTQRSWARWAWRSSWGLTIVVLLIVQAFMSIVDHVARLDLVAGQPRAVLRNLYGWPEVGQAAAAAADALRARPDCAGVFFISNQYGTAAALSFYTPDRPSVHLWSAVRNHGRNYGYWDDWSALRGLDAVYVVKRPLAEWEEPFMREHFAEVLAVESVPIIDDGEERNTFYLVRCRGFDGREPFPTTP